jgi:3-hydroxyisobutyrate dehydrogenase
MAGKNPPSSGFCGMDGGDEKTSELRGLLFKFRFLSMSRNRIGFVGVGRMGANMARRLRDLDYSVVVYDQHPELAVALADEIGCRAVRTLPEVTAAADVIFTVVTDDAAMDGIFEGAGSLLVGGEAAGKVFINCATLSPGAHEKAAGLAAAAGAETLGASMASSIPQARSGTLYLMVGGKRDVFERMEPLLKDLSSSLKHVGVVGDAAKIKALVNMVMNCNTAALAEGLGLGSALGLDAAMLKDVFAHTGANSRVLETDADDMILREHDCFFSVSHAAKDSGIANALAVRAGIRVPLSEATEAQYRRLDALGLGGLDKSAIAELTFPGRSEVEA